MNEWPALFNDPRPTGTLSNYADNAQTDKENPGPQVQAGKSSQVCLFSIRAFSLWLKNT